jgi:agmatinase
LTIDLPETVNFLGIPDDEARYETARGVVVPVPWEATVSYGAGTAKGPAAILDASRYVELYDEVLREEPYKKGGIHTAAPADVTGGDPVAFLDGLESIAAGLFADGKFPVFLGGEHSLTTAPVRAARAAFEDVSVLQFDAHADLRDGYLGEHYSHAAAMRRVLDHPNVSLVSVGIRAISKGEADFYAKAHDRVRIHWGKDQAQWDIEEIVAPLRGKPVYVTFDVDGLDSAIMPATGTPVPGGLSYLQALAILRRAAEVSTIVGADMVELAPIPGLHHCDYTAAALAYKIMSYALSGTWPRAGQRGS